MLIFKISQNDKNPWSTDRGLSLWITYATSSQVGFVGMCGFDTPVSFNFHKCPDLGGGFRQLYGHHRSSLGDRCLKIKPWLDPKHSGWPAKHTVDGSWQHRRWNMRKAVPQWILDRSSWIAEGKQISSLLLNPCFWRREHSCSRLGRNFLAVLPLVQKVGLLMFANLVSFCLILVCVYTIFYNTYIYIYIYHIYIYTYVCVVVNVFYIFFVDWCRLSNSLCT